MVHAQCRNGALKEHIQKLNTLCRVCGKVVNQRRNKLNFKHEFLALYNVNLDMDVNEVHPTLVCHTDSSKLYRYRQYKASGASFHTKVTETVNFLPHNPVHCMVCDDNDERFPELDTPLSPIPRAKADQVIKVGRNGSIIRKCLGEKAERNCGKVKKCRVENLNRLCNEAESTRDQEMKSSCGMVEAGQVEEAGEKRQTVKVEDENKCCLIDSVIKSVGMEKVRKTVVIKRGPKGRLGGNVLQNQVERPSKKDKNVQRNPVGRPRKKDKNVLRNTVGRPMNKNLNGLRNQGRRPMKKDLNGLRNPVGRPRKKDLNGLQNQVQRPMKKDLNGLRNPVGRPRKKDQSGLRNQMRLPMKKDLNSLRNPVGRPRKKDQNGLRNPVGRPRKNVVKIVQQSEEQTTKSCDMMEIGQIQRVRINGESAQKYHSHSGAQTVTRKAMPGGLEAVGDAGRTYFTELLARGGAEMNDGPVEEAGVEKETRSRFKIMTERIEKEMRNLITITTERVEKETRMRSVPFMTSDVDAIVRMIIDLPVVDREDCLKRVFKLSRQDERIRFAYQLGRSSACDDV